MNKKTTARQNFLNYLEGTLSSKARLKFEEQLKEHPELQTELDEYRKIVQWEIQARQQSYQIDSEFVDDVMQALENLNETPEAVTEMRSLKMSADKDKLKFKLIRLGLMAVSLLLVLLVAPTNYQPLIFALVLAGLLASYLSKSSLGFDRRIAALACVILIVITVQRGLHSRYIEDNGLRVAEPVEQVASDTAPAETTAEFSIIPESDDIVSNNKRHTTATRSFRADTDMLDKMEQNAGISYGNLVPQEAIIPAHPTNTERYYQVSENKPQLTAENPLSTFSIDVDTGSYTNSRRFLRAGSLPPKEAVRIEEFVNYFDYNYPRNHNSEAPFATDFELAPSPDQSGRHLLKIGIHAHEQISQSQADQPWNLVFLIDVSGSMSGEMQLGLVKKALTLLAKQMRSADKISIVTYAGTAGIALQPTSKDNLSLILATIENLGAGGSTHGSQGILTAYRLAEESKIPEGVNRVILATDGDFNVGTTDRSALESLIEEKRRTGITLTTIGVGEGNYNEAIMEQLANKGNGNYFYLDSFAEARKVFQEQLTGTLAVVAKDVKLQIEFNPERVKEHRLIGYDNRRLEHQDFNNDQIDAGEIGAGHRVTALYELVLHGSTVVDNKVIDNQVVDPLRYATATPEAIKTTIPTDSQFSQELAFLKIRYKAPNGDISKLTTAPVTDAAMRPTFSAASTDFRFASAVAGVAAKLSHSQYAPKLSYQQLAQLAEAAVGEDPHGYRREFVSLVKNLAATTNP